MSNKSKFEIRAIVRKMISERTSDKESLQKELEVMTQSVMAENYDDKEFAKIIDNSLLLPEVNAIINDPDKVEECTELLVNKLNHGISLWKRRVADRKKRSLKEPQKSAPLLDEELTTLSRKTYREANDNISGAARLFEEFTAGRHQKVELETKQFLNFLSEGTSKINETSTELGIRMQNLVNTASRYQTQMEQAVDEVFGIAKKAISHINQHKSDCEAKFSSFNDSVCDSMQKVEEALKCLEISKKDLKSVRWHRKLYAFTLIVVNLVLVVVGATVVLTYCKSVKGDNVAIKATNSS